MRAISGLLLVLAAANAQPDWLEKGISEFHHGDYAAAQASLQQASDSPRRAAFLALARAAGGGATPREPISPKSSRRRLTPNCAASLAWLYRNVSSRRGTPTMRLLCWRV